MNHADLLIEIGMEELPTQAVESLSHAFKQNILDLFEKAQIVHQSHQVFATPRRIALLIKQVATQTPAQTLEHRGPPTTTGLKAAQGFADKFKISADQLEKLTTDKGEYFVFKQTLAPQTTTTLLLNLIEQALQTLPIKKPMSWGEHTFKFIRPVHWVLVLFGDKILDGKIFNQTIGQSTYGHRFLNNSAIHIDKPERYEDLLKEKGFVIADFAKRKNEIKKQIETIGAEKTLTPIIDEDLLHEVTSIVEWPVALMGQFAEEFLKLPAEVISLTLKQNQKSFVLKDINGQLQPYFITIANIKSNDPQQVISGNEKVVRARLSDAAFFFAQDRKQTLAQYADALAHVIFQQNLGSLLDKSKRVSSLVEYFAPQLNLNAADMAHAGLLCKADLVSQMVSEFPELQGIMGAHYAAQEKQNAQIVSAIHDHYQPQGAGDQIPATTAGAALAIADKLDTICGIFALGKKPTGDKDPFALKRAMIGILRIIIEKQLCLDLKSLLEFSLKQQPVSINTDSVLSEILTFSWDRLDAWLREAHIPPELLSCVTAIACSKPYDMYLRIIALKEFVKKPEAASLASAHKRVNNLLAKQNLAHVAQLKQEQLIETQEKELAKLLKAQDQEVKTLCQQQNYSAALLLLATLRPTLDAFFDKVLVMCEDESLKQNRLALLKQLSDLFLQVADLSYLPVNHETAHHS